MKYWISFLSLLALSFGASAKGSHVTKIDSVHIDQNGWASVYVATPVPSDLNVCTQNRWIYLVGDRASTNYKAMIANAQLALVGGFDVVMWLDGCASNGGADHNGYQVRLMRN